MLQTLITQALFILIPTGGTTLLGKVKTEKLSNVWRDTKAPLMLGVRESPRLVKGRCAKCQYLGIVGVNTHT